MQEFLRALRESGELIVGAEPPAELEVELERALREHDTVFRDELAPDAPELAIDAAHWGAKKLYQSCQLLTMRDAPPAVAHDTLLDPYDGPRGPETEYSVDLTLAYLPSLFHLAERVAPDDPVLDAVRQLASEWPLSSVGISGIDCPTRLLFWENHSLRTLYVDRLLETRDLTRLEDPLVARTTQAALGAYPELEPKIMEFLNAS